MADKVRITAQIPQGLVDTLTKLANERGVSANAVLEQAIETEQFIFEKKSDGKKLLIENDDHSMVHV